MNLKSVGTPLALALLTTLVQAQAAPVFIPLGGTDKPLDVAISSTEGAVVVGTQSGGTFRWTLAGGKITIGVDGNVPIRISSDASTIVADVASSPTRTAIWSGAGVSWNPIATFTGGLTSAGTETTTGGVSADGSVIAGMGYTAFNVNHAYRHTGGSPGLTVDADPPSGGDGSRAWDISGDGSLIVGWNSGSQYGARFAGGVMTPFLYLTQSTGHALAVNHTGSIVVGTRLQALASSAWRWDSGTNLITPLPNLPADTLIPYAYDLTDDGSLIVGADSAQFMVVPKSIIWVNNVPQDLETYLNGLGMPSTGYTNLGTATAITRDGSAIVGYGTNTGGQPGGWIVLFPSKLQTGTALCFGDGTDTPCPCTNNGATGRGCENTFATGGASLSATGVASISADSLVLHGANTGPFQFGLFFEGSATANPTAPFGLTFGNGVRCVNFTGANRLEIRQADGTGASDTTVALSIPGFAVAGTTYYYQLWYRDGVPPTPIGTCLATAGFNFSHALSLTWTF